MVQKTRSNACPQRTYSSGGWGVGPCKHLPTHMENYSCDKGAMRPPGAPSTGEGGLSQDKWEGQAGMLSHQPWSHRTEQRWNPGLLL